MPAHYPQYDDKVIGMVQNSTHERKRMTTAHGTATPKQVSYAKALLERAGYATDAMDDSFVELGATPEIETQSTYAVHNWLESRSKAGISELIDKLVTMTEDADAGPPPPTQKQMAAIDQALARVERIDIFDSFGGTGRQTAAEYRARVDAGVSRKEASDILGSLYALIDDEM